MKKTNRDFVEDYFIIKGINACLQDIDKLSSERQQDLYSYLQNIDDTRVNYLKQWINDRTN